MKRIVTKEEFKKLVNEKFQNRKNRLEHPDGEFDSAQRWEPSESEKCECCMEIRRPSRAYPFSLMVHCRTRKHVESLLEKEYQTQE